MLIFEPDEGTQPVAGIVMFHDGVLHSGSADGLAPHCRELASRGIFAGSAGYHIAGPPGWRRTRTNRWGRAATGQFLTSGIQLQAGDQRFSRVQRAELLV
jgi:hypothetical protein